MAYAALVLLMQNLEEILHLDSYRIPPNKDRIESLQEEVNFLKLFLEDPREKGVDHEKVKKLEERMIVAAQKAADFIDSNTYISKTRPICLPQRDFGWKQISQIAHGSVSQIAREMESLKLEAEKLFENKISNETEVLVRAGNPSRQDLTSSSTNAGDKLVGIDADIEKLLHQLTGQQLRCRVIPIVGMAGIGKTTIAQRIYNDQLVLSHFHIRAWITIPHIMAMPYRTKEILLGLLQCFTNITDDMRKMKNGELGGILYRNLKCKIYLVVLDDMWYTVDWDNLKIYFPDDGNGSRIILTSRIVDTAVYVNPTSSPHHMHFLEDTESWQLLESKLGSCPQELIEIGKRIAVKCQGLPLAIVVVAGILNKMDKTLESWLKIAESADALVAEDPNHCTNILALSYNYLPNSLKACFLYMGVFPREYEIHVSRLIWLWVAEGFILPAEGRSLEDVAEDSLEDLVNRNLILVGKRRSNGRIKTCHVHDLLRDLCLREAQKENFLHVMRYAPTFLMEVVNARRISLHASVLLHFHMQFMHPVPLTRTFLWYDTMKNPPDAFLLEIMDKLDFKLLRVLDIEMLPCDHFPIEVVDLIHLRYLALAVNGEIPSSIIKLQKLETLVIDHIWEGQYLPQEIWEMPRLRHIRLKRGCYFPVPYSKGQLVLKNLQTLSTLVGPDSCSKEVFACLPSLRKLEIFATGSECLSNLACLNQLETLKCSFLYKPTMHRLSEVDKFPANLKKLTLCGSYLPWEDMAILALLPNLEVLKLRSFAFDGYKWELVENGFLRLKFLLLENSDPGIWDADKNHFPELEQLVLRNCNRLLEIPQDIGDIPTLQMIEVHDCSLYLVRSAREIHEQQQMLGNDELRIRIT